jgi:putative ABC transport system substrate-binding protein
MNKNKYLFYYPARRALLATAAAWPALAWAGAVFAQSKQPVLIGWLHSASRKTNERSLAAFKEGMAELGWKEGSNFVLEKRWANGRVDRLPALAGELAAKKPAVIVAGPSVAVAAASKAAPGTPIVVASGDPVGSGLVKNLARPGGNITGVSNVSAQVNEKYPELLVAAVPTLRRIGFLSDPGASNRVAYMETARRSTTRYGVEALFADAARPEEIEPAIARLAKDRAQALVLLPSNFFVAERQTIVKLSLANRWPIIAGPRPWAEAGALLTYGPDSLVLTRRAAYYVDRILKGAKPGDLPIEQPTKFELVINMKTAKALGITIPQDFLFRADRVIE